MPTLRLDRPLWLEPSGRARRTRYPPLRRNLTVDVAIVGAGVTGAVMAWMLASEGISVAVSLAGTIRLPRARPCSDGRPGVTRVCG